MGLAFLPDGTRMDYRDYLHHPRWKQVRQKRLEFDNYQCAVCHLDLRGDPYETHHLTYQRLGRERLRDVITVCPSCHKIFHENWQRVEYWKGKEPGHWQIYDLQVTAEICARSWRLDRYICRDPAAPNMCNTDVAGQAVDDFFRDEHLTVCPVVDPHDVVLFIRNKRYELYFAAERQGMTVEQWLDSYFGEKVRGKNPLRQEAGKKNGPFDHTPAAFHKHYNENKNILILMREVERIEKEDHNAET